MKTNKQLLAIVIALVFSAGSLLAQTRYYDEIFTNVLVTANVKYGENYSLLTGAPVLQDLLMDVYEPVGDTMSQRPLIILSHAGSFLPKDAFLPFGYKNDSMLIEMCTQLAKRGWIAVAMTYRIGWNPLGADETTRKSTIINAVYRAMQDKKACVRYFRQDAATTNTYKINPNKVIVGGSNSGAYVALAHGALNKPSEITLLKFLNPETGKSVIDTLVTGGFYGEGGCEGVNAPLNNPGYSSAVQAVVNMGGAIGDTTWQDAGEPPIISFHGIADPLTPYMTAVVIVAATGQPVVEVSGSHDLSRRAVNLGNQDIFYALNRSDPYTQVAESRTAFEGLLPFPGPANGFEPWAWYDSSLAKIARPDATNPSYTGYGSAANPFASRAKAETYIDSIFSYFTPRALEAFNHVDLNAVQTPDKDNPPVDCTSGIAFNNIVDAAVQVFPNPASSKVMIQILDGRFVMESVRVLDITGKEVMFETLNGEPTHVIKRNGLGSGVYFINVNFTDGRQSFRRIIFE